MSICIVVVDVYRYVGTLYADHHHLLLFAFIYFYQPILSSSSWWLFFFESHILTFLPKEKERKSWQDCSTWDLMRKKSAHDDDDVVVETRLIWIRLDWNVDCLTQWLNKANVNVIIIIKIIFFMFAIVPNNNNNNSSMADDGEISERELVKTIKSYEESYIMPYMFITNSTIQFIDTFLYFQPFLHCKFNLCLFVSCLSNLLIGWPPDCVCVCWHGESNIMAGDNGDWNGDDVLLLLLKFLIHSTIHSSLELDSELTNCQ